MAGYFNNNYCIDSKVYSKSNGNEIAEFVLIIFLALMVSSIAVFIYSKKTNPFTGNSNPAGNTENNFQQTTTSKDNSDKYRKNIIKVDDNIFISLNQNDKIAIQLPKAFQYLTDHFDNTEETNYYIETLSLALNKLTQQSLLKNSSLFSLSKKLSEYVDFYNSINSKKNSLLSNNISPDDKELNQKLINLLIFYQGCMTELTDDNQHLLPVNSDSTRYCLRHNLKTALNTVILDDKLDKDIKFLTQTITNQILLISSETQINLPEKEYLKSKKIIANLVISSNQEYTIKDNLLNALNTDLDDSNSAKIFVVTLSNVLSSTPDSFNQLSSRQKQVIIKTLKSIHFKFNQSNSSLLDYNIGRKYNCYKKNGSYIEGNCFIR